MKLDLTNTMIDNSKFLVKSVKNCRHFPGLMEF